MKLYHYIKQALRNLVSNKLRSFLAILGILIGTASVVALMSSASLATETALAQFKSLGTNLLAVRLYQKDDASNKARANEFTVNDVSRLAKKTPGIKASAPYTMTFLPTYYQGEKLSSVTIGVTQSIQQVLKIKIKKGRFLSALDGHAYFCVIGHALYKKLRPHHLGPLIGSQLRMGDRYFTIIGIADKWQRNNFFDQDVNHAILIPLASAKLINTSTPIRNILFRLNDSSQNHQVENNLKRYIATYHSDIKLFYRSADSIIQSMEAQQHVFVYLLGLIGAISLLVGGIGVMNIMLVSVAERQNEIGIRMAIGARKKDIRYLFLIESVCLTLFGGILGIVLGIAVSFVLALFAHWQFHLYLMPTLLGFTVSASCGIFFGYYPANRAAQLDPIVTLRAN